VDTVVFVRDHLMIGVIFGVASFVWFGWGQEDPPRAWRAVLGIGAALGAVLALASGFFAWRNWSAATVFDLAKVASRFGVVVGAEVLICGVGALVLARKRLTRYIAPWICGVVGLHFVPLALLFANATLLLPALVMVLVAILSVRAGRQGRLTPSAGTGLGAGTVLLLTSGLNLALGLSLG
jgi:hypothetical protein